MAINDDFGTPDAKWNEISRDELVSAIELRKDVEHIMLQDDARLIAPYHLHKKLVALPSIVAASAIIGTVDDVLSLLMVNPGIVEMQAMNNELNAKQRHCR